MTVPTEIQRLAERFELHIDAYKSGHYNETQVRREFIDPFFKALGWDIDNEQGYAEAYKDVVHEDAIRIGRDYKAPDYSFRVGGTRKFFVEAKKPSVNIKDDLAPAYQLRRYAWSAKLPLSIVTDFEEFAVYDCRIKPAKEDKPAKARVMYTTYDKYEERWDEIADIFHRQAVLKGSFDKYAESNKAKRGTAEVDKAFLEEIEAWRDLLARNIALRNADLTQRELNFAVQQTIDRIIFLRICEDRGIEPYGRLMALQSGGRVYRRLVEQFRAADDRYNSGLFHFRAEKGRPEPPDELTPRLTIDDKPLKHIIEHLYYPESPYEFSVLPADILGQVYEQFLGKVIRLTKGHRAVVEDKPEVKKAGGVYYTPTYIVDYIVENTLGKLLQARTWRQAAKLKVLDPACGSGSFLIGAYQYLLDWHRERYLEEGAEKHRKRLYQDRHGEWRLTTAARKKILLDNIHGVDIDPQAVEVTKLSLLLKVLEGESAESLRTQFEMFRERALPDLANNIKCGNSLVGPNFYDDQQLDLLDEESRFRINVFDWQTEFLDIMKYGGFDAVIGNPPYIDSELMVKLRQEERKYCVQYYASASGNWDLFCIFVEKGLHLCRESGISAMIVPNKLATAEYATKVRSLISRNNCLLNIRDYSDVPVFPVAVYPIVYVVKKQQSEDKSVVKHEKVSISDEDLGFQISENELVLEEHFSRDGSPWIIFGDLIGHDLVRRLKNSNPTLEQIATVTGAATVAEAYELVPILHDAPTDETDGLPVVNSGTIDRYVFLWGHKRCRYLGLSMLRPTVASSDLAQLPERRRLQAESEKIVVAGMTRRLECSVDISGQFLAAKSTTIIQSNFDLRLLVGVLNSSLISYIYEIFFGGNKLGGGYLRIGPPQLRKIPIHIVDADNKNEVYLRDSIIKAVKEISKLQKLLLTTRTVDEKTILQRKCASIDRQIDRHVYQLYGLTNDEIRLVEAAGRNKD